MCKGNSPQTVTQNNAPPSWVQNAYQNLIGQGQQVAQQPLQQYTGPMVAGFTPQQQQAFSTIQNSQGLALPYLNSAAQYMSNAATPISVPGGLGSNQIGGLFNQGLGYTGNAANAPIAASANPYLASAGESAANAGNALNRGLVGNALSTSAGGLGYAANAQNLLNPNLIGQGLGAAQGAMSAAGSAANSLNPQQVSNALQFGRQGLGYAGQGQGAVNAAGNTAMNAASTNVYGSLPQFNQNTVGQYLNPYTQSVVGSTQAQFANENAQQRQQLIGNSISQGAFGGDREAVAEGELANQQQLAQAPVIAGLYSQGFGQAAQEFQAQQQLQAQTEAQRAALGAQTALGAGGQQLQAAGLGASTALSNQGAGLQAAGMAQQGNLTAAQLGTQAGLGAGAQYQGAAGLGAQYGLAGSQLGLNAALGVGSQELQGAGLGAQYGLAASQLGAQTGLSSAQQSAAAQQAQAALRQQAAAQMMGLGTGQQQADIGAQQASGWLGQNAGFGLASLGNMAQNSLLTGASANLNAGTAQQQQAQQQLNVPYEQYLQQQAYPYQQLNFLSGLTTGAGSLAGGQSSTGYPAPSALSQGLGGLMGAAGVLGQTGAFGSSANGYSNGWLTGSGGLLGEGTASFDPATQSWTPAAGGFPTDPNSLGGSGGYLSGLGSSLSSAGSWLGNGLSSAWSGLGLKRGGRAHYDDGGAVDPTGPEYPTSPLLAGVYQNYLSMPIERLQELSVRFPPESTQGQVVRKALTMKQMQQPPQFGLGDPQAQQQQAASGFAAGGAVDFGNAVTVQGLGSSPISYMQGSRGIAIPQLDRGALTQSSAGLGDAFNPLPQMSGSTTQAYNPLPQLSAPPTRSIPTILSQNPVPGSSLNGAPGSGLGGANSLLTPGQQDAQSITPGQLVAQTVKNASSKGSSAGLGSASGAAIGTMIEPGIGTAVGALGGALAGTFASNLFRPNSPAINDISAAQGRGQAITDAQWNQAGYGPGGAYLTAQQLLQKAPGQKDNAPLRDIVGALHAGKPVSDASWAQAGLPAAGGAYGAQLVSQISAMKGGTPQVGLGAGNPTAPDSNPTGYGYNANNTALLGILGGHLRGGANGKSNSSALQDIAGAVSRGQTISNKSWSQARLPAGGGIVGQQLQAAILGPQGGLGTAPLAATNPMVQPSGLGAYAKRGGRFADGGDADDDSDELAGLGSGPQDGDIPDAYGLGDNPPAQIPTDEGAPEQVNVSAGSSPREHDFTPPDPDPWNALAMAGAATMARGSPYAMQNIGQGLMTGTREYDREKELDSKPMVDHSGSTVMVYYGKHQFDTGIPTEGQQRVDAETAHYKELEDQGQARNAIESQKLEGANQQAIENRVYREQAIAAQRKRNEDTAQVRDDAANAGKYTLIPGTGKDENGNDTPGSYVFNGKTGESQFHAGLVQTGKPGGAGPSVSQWKYNAWLGVHPDDKQGALDFVAGHRTLGQADAIKFGLSQAAREGLSGGQADARSKAIAQSIISAGGAGNAPQAAQLRVYNPATGKLE